MLDAVHDVEFERAVALTNRRDPLSNQLAVRHFFERLRVNARCAFLGVLDDIRRVQGQLGKRIDFNGAEGRQERIHERNQEQGETEGDVKSGDGGEESEDSENGQDASHPAPVRGTPSGSAQNVRAFAS